MRVAFSIVLTLLSYALLAQPDNDNCEDAMVISDGMSQTLNSVLATTDGPEQPNAACFSFGGDNVHNDIWFLYTASTSGYVEWSTCSSANFDTRLAVYASGVSCPVEDADLLACSDDGISCSNFTSRLLFETNIGETYLLRLGGYVEGDFGEGTFDLMPIPDPEFSNHNNCADADFVAVVTQEQADENEGWVYGSNFFAPAENDVAPPSCIPVGEFYDVWYSFNNGMNDTIIFNFQANTDSASFAVELYEDCGTIAPTQSDGGEVLIGCFLMPDGFSADMEFTGFESANDYILRIATQITNDFPGNFQFQLIGNDQAVALSELEEEKFTLYPNPANALVWLKMPVTQTRVDIFDVNGKICFSEVKRSNQAIDVSQFKPGVYFVLFQYEESVIRRKLLID
ncbi:MAG: T9SS type A sorting domain-containing protein [Bacteroidota bacterium]